MSFTNHFHVVLSLALTCLVRGLIAADAQENDSAQPNIVFLLTDDQRWDALGAMGNAWIQTPQLDKLANEGVLFRNAYVTTAICCISRASILSGQYASRHGIVDFSTPFAKDALQETYPLMLRQAGYRTGFIGKYGVGSNGQEPVESYDYWKAMGGQPRYENKQPDGSIKHYTDILSEQCRDFLDGCKQGQPFCLSVSFKAPHVQDSDPRQFIYNPRYKELYASVTLPAPATAAAEFFNRLPACLSTEENEARRRWQMRFSTPEKYQEMVKGYYRLITGVDDAVGQLRQDLEELGFADNTIIIFTGDHGFYLGEHGLAGKWYGHEESIRVPLIVYQPSAPGSPRHQNRDEMVLNIDLAPTLLELAGVKAPNRIQGRSLVPLLEGKHPSWRQDFFYEHRFPHNRIPQSEGVVTPRYKYLRYVETEPVQEELYDLGEDPHEARNLAGDPAHAGLRRQMVARYEQLKKAAQ